MSNGAGNGGTGSGVAILDFVNRGLGIVLTCGLGMIVWQGQTALETLADHDVRLARIEANRFTAGDALAEQRLVNEQISALRSLIQQEVRAQREWVQQNFPPGWLVEDLQDLKKEIRELRLAMQQSGGGT